MTSIAYCVLKVRHEDLMQSVERRKANQKVRRAWHESQMERARISIAHSRMLLSQPVQTTASAPGDSPPPDDQS